MQQEASQKLTSSQDNIQQNETNNVGGVPNQITDKTQESCATTNNTNTTTANNQNNITQQLNQMTTNTNMTTAAYIM